MKHPVKNTAKNTVVVGAQWGDEGKAKITDLLAQDADIVVRYQGGCNAGHTVHCGDRVFKFHLIPSGILYPDKLCVIGPGTVIHPDTLLQELEGLQKQGVSTQNLKISDRAHVTLPFHTQIDQAQEHALAGQKIGTTGKGIGPTYADKISRQGLRMGDLYLPETLLKERLSQLLARKTPVLEAIYGLQPQSLEALLSYCQDMAQQLKPYVTDTTPLLYNAHKAGQRILFEGAQGTLLDVDHGTYPYVTSSNPTAGGACTGAGVGPTMIQEVIGVMKAYTTRVGEGPFLTELPPETDSVGKHLVEIGREYGTTTGRIRRCGWFDAIIGRYSVQVNGLSSIALTKLDVLDGLDELKICVAYQNPQTGEQLTQFPSRLEDLQHLQPVYETLPGWSGESVMQAQCIEDLPLNARRYLDRIVTLLETPISLLSLGPERTQTLILSPCQPSFVTSTTDTLQPA